MKKPSRFRLLRRLALAAFALNLSAAAWARPGHVAARSVHEAAAQTVVLRHALSGQAEAVLVALVARFNEQQKGRALVLLQDANSAPDPGQAPQMALLDTDDARSFFGTVPRFKPLYRVLAEARTRIRAPFFPLVKDAVDDPAGRLQALPLGLALPVLFWNKDAFVKAGLDPERAPKTWLELQHAAGRLLDAGQKCPLTSSRFNWVHLENISSQYGEPITVREGRGATKVVLNRLIDVQHLALISSWNKSHYFRYFGPGDEADRRFLSGECAMLTGASSLYPQAAHAGFAMGIAKLPQYDDVYGATPGRLLPDGAALWVLDGQTRLQDEVAARFVMFMLRPEVQRDWVKATGFLPMTPVAIAALKADGEPPDLLDAAARRLSERNPLPAEVKRGFGLTRLRRILSEEVAAVWNDSKSPMDALDAAMRRINAAGGRRPGT